MRGLLADCRHAVRLYRRTPVTSAIAIVALAVALAFVSAFLSLYVGLALRPPAGFEHGDRLVTLGQTDGETLSELPYSLIERLAEEMSSLDAVAGSTMMPPAVDEAGDEVVLDVVTRGFFDGLHPRLHSGRGLEPTDHTPESGLVAVISYRYWQEALGGRDVLGTTLRLALQPSWIMFGDTDEEEEEQTPEFRIVGILAPEASGLVPDADIWLPFERVRPFFIIVPKNRIQGTIALSTFATLARKAEGASTRAVITEFEARYGNDEEAQTIQSGLRFEAVDGIVTDLEVLRESKRQLLIFLAASVLLALVAAANVSLFLLARAPRRRRELGVRLAVGAPVRRLARQLASEAGLIVVASAVLGLFIGFICTSLFRNLSFLRLARWQDVSLLDWRVLILVAGFMLLLSGLVALAPVLGLKRMSIAASSRQVSARASIAQRIAGTSQIAIAGTLAGAAIAFGWHLASITFADPGFALRDRYRVGFDFDMSSVRSSDDVERLQASQNLELQRARAAIEAMPGVTGVGFGNPVPGSGYNYTTSVPRPDRPGEYLTVGSGSIDPGYVDVLDLKLRHGRAPAASDTDVVLVNRTLAQALFGRDDVVGETMQRSRFFGNTESTIVGVLEDVAYGHPSAGVEPLMLTSIGDRNLPSVAVVETRMTAAQLQQALDAIAATGDLEVSVDRVEPLAFLRSRLIAPDRARGLLTIGAATLVVLLAAFGFYGTQRYLVSAGRREYAIRSSLGAGPSAIGRLVIRRALTLSLPGLVAGGLLAFIVVGWLRADYIARDIPTAVVALAVVVGLGLILTAASLGPVREARRTEPAPLLRED